MVATFQFAKSVLFLVSRPTHLQTKSTERIVSTVNAISDVPKRIDVQLLSSNSRQAMYV